MLGFLSGSVDVLLEEQAQETGFCKGKHWEKSTKGIASITSIETKASWGMAARDTPWSPDGSEGKEGRMVPFHGIIW